MLVDWLPGQDPGTAAGAAENAPFGSQKDLRDFTRL